MASLTSPAESTAGIRGMCEKPETHRKQAVDNEQEAKNEEAGSSTTVLL